jgi:hypothetical protein
MAEMGKDVQQDLDDLTQDIEESLDAEAAPDPEEEGVQPEGEEEAAEAEEETAEQAEPEYDEQGNEVKKPAIQPYTDDEVLKVLDTDGKLDSRRLTPTQKLIQKSFARYANKGFEQIATMKRELEAQQEQIRTQQQMATPPRSLEEAYDRDPDNVLRFIDQQIASTNALAQEDPFKAQQQLINLQMVRNRLIDRAMHTTEHRRAASEAATNAVRDVLNAIPDFGPEKQQVLSDFAIRELGYSQEELKSLTHPSNGKIAAQTVKTIHAAWFAKYGEKQQMKKTVETKKVVKRPVVEGAAKRDDGKATANVAMNRAMKKAQDSGDWTEVLNLKGVLPRLTK